jgi:excisionase family DNA binding protein
VARHSLAENLSIGVLTPPNLAELAGVSTPTVYKWIREKLFKGFVQIPGSREYRISAKAVKVYFESKDWPVSKDLTAAAKQFTKRFNDDFTPKLAIVPPSK